MKNQEMIYVSEGSRITLQDKAYRYSYAFFALKRPEEYLYSYAYQAEENWCTYEEEYSSDGFLDTDTTFGSHNMPPEKEGYIRLSIERCACSASGESAQDSPVTVTGGTGSLEDREKQFLQREDVQQETERVVGKVQAIRTEQSLVFTLLSDTHYVLNGNWEMTAATIEAVNRRIKPDGVIHLGDFTDGMLDREICTAYGRKVIDRLKNPETPLYLCIGNHDSNYFRKNPDRLTDREQFELYLKNTVNAELTENQLWYYKDFPKYHLRMLFLHSYDHNEKLRYGFPEEEIAWVKDRLEELPEDYQIVIFSHDAPLARLDYWASEIRNGEALTEVLEQWQVGHGNRILAFVHGHTHADFVYTKRTFPIVSVGCSKLEYFEDKKPEGAVTPVREEGTVYQELWDTMIIHPEEKIIDFVRFGAGTDRQVTAQTAETDEKKCKIWAHRGASGYAPENTLEAFRLAAELGADGVELDVQLTKDREIVVIHDEKIDRTGSGRGYVADHTLEELRRYNYNRTKPEYPHADIPTLREVLELLRPTALTVNIELKTGVNFYPGIERAVTELVKQMGMEERVIYSSFNHLSILKIKELCPAAKTGLLYHDGTVDMPDYAKRLAVEALHPAMYNMRYPGFVRKCKELDIALHVWTANEPKRIQELLQYGVDAVITNYPDIAYEIIHGKSISKPDPLKEDTVKEEAKPETVRTEAKSEIMCEKVKSETVQKEADPGTAQEQTEDTAAPAAPRKKNPLLHGAGIAYSKVRKVFVAIDRAVQKAAGK